MPNTRLAAPTGHERNRRQAALLIALLALGAAVRLYVNDVAEFSRADETTYLTHAREMAGQFLSGFPRFARAYAEDPSAWPTPPPMRWGHWALISAACALAGRCDYHVLAWVSTLGGIAALLFTWLLARELVGSRAALVAVALSIAAPLQLHLGRRALQDEVACAAMLAALWAFVRALRRDAAPSAADAHIAGGLYNRTVSPASAGVRLALLAALVGALAIAEKETTLLWAPSLGALWLMRARDRGWRACDLLLLLAPLLSLAGFFALSRSFTLFFADARGNLGTLDSSGYVAQYMSGPGYRVLVDLFILAPATFLLATAAAGALLFEAAPAVPAAPRAADARGARELACLLAVGLAVWSFGPKDARYTAAADALARILAAWLLVALWANRRWPAWLLACAIALNASYEARLFQRISIERAVYDPTTVDILRALDAVPR